MYAEKTRELFAGLIERPPLTDQLLQRPPFRFLHDVVHATIQNTGFLTDVFTNEELDSSNIADKTSKTNFLKKLIKALNDDGSLKDVKATKIVAGKEPEMTNLMLQKLAVKAASFRTSQLNGSIKEESVQKDKKGHKKERRSKNEGRRSSQEENKQDEMDKEKRRVKKSREKRTKERENVPTAVVETAANEERKGSIDEGHFEDVDLPVKVNEVVHTDQEPSGTAKTEDSGIADDITNESEQSSLPLIPKELRLSSSGRPRTSAGRPGTAAARPAPPKLKKKQLAETERKPETDLKLNKVIVDERKEDDEDFVIEVEPPANEIEGTDAEKLITEEHGGLVRKILETKKELDQKISQEAFKATSVFVEKEQAKSQAELANLQQIMQQITQTAYPLTRLFDFVQEDADSMVKEIEECRTEIRKNLNDSREKKANEKAMTEDLLLRLNQLQEEVKEMKNAIAQTRANTIAIEQKILSFISDI